MTRQYDVRRSSESPQKDSDNWILQRSAVRSLPAKPLTPQTELAVGDRSGIKLDLMQIPVSNYSANEIKSGKRTFHVPEFQGISSQLWGDSGQVDEPIQRKEKDDVVVSEVGPENKTGLPDNLKAGVENLSGYSLDDVRVHYNSPKPAQLEALAYTQGTEIHVAPGQEKHLPHEAWHVVQQMQGRVKPTMQMKGKQINDDEGLEMEADVMKEKLVANESTHVVQQNGEGIRRSQSSNQQLSQSSLVQRKVTIKRKEININEDFLKMAPWDKWFSPDEDKDEIEVARWLFELSPTWDFSEQEDLVLYINKVYSMTKLIRSVFANGILSRGKLEHKDIEYVGSEDVGNDGQLAVNVLDSRGGVKDVQEIAEESMTAEDRGSISVALERQNDWVKNSPDQDQLAGEWTKPEDIILTDKDIANIKQGAEMGLATAIEKSIRNNKALERNQELLNNLYGPEMKERAQNTIMAIVTKPSEKVANLSPRDASYESDVPEGKIPYGNGGFTTLLIPQWYKQFYPMIKDDQPDEVEIRFVGDKEVIAYYKSYLGHIPVTVNAPNYANEVASALKKFQTIATHILTA